MPSTFSDLLIPTCAPVFSIYLPMSVITPFLSFAVLLVFLSSQASCTVTTRNESSVEQSRKILMNAHDSYKQFLLSQNNGDENAIIESNSSPDEFSTISMEAARTFSETPEVNSIEVSSESRFIKKLFKRIKKGVKRGGRRIRNKLFPIPSGMRRCSSRYIRGAGVSNSDPLGPIIRMKPTVRGRLTARFSQSAYNRMWNDLKRCITFPSLSHDAYRSVYQQFVCHVVYAVAPWGGGDTWDFESWRPKFSGSDALDYLNPSHKCNWD